MVVVGLGRRLDRSVHDRAVAGITAQVESIYSVFSACKICTKMQRQRQSTLR